MTEAEHECIKPDWHAGGRVHNWRHYVNHEVRNSWQTFTPDQRAMLYRQARDMADKEHRASGIRGLCMVAT